MKYACMLDRFKVLLITRNYSALRAPPSLAPAPGDILQGKGDSIRAARGWSLLLLIYVVGQIR